MNPPSDSQRQRMKSAFEDAAHAHAAENSPTLPVAPEVALRPGQIIGKCVIVRELGRGGMGAVYLAKHTTLDVPVAVKVLPPSIARSEQYAERFLREARLAATMRHPNVLAVMDADRDPATGLFYMVMEYVDGGSIADRLARGPLPEKAAAQVVTGVARALSTAEKQGIVHRDIKPANILVTKDGRVKLADLGLAKRAGQAEITQSAAALGTPFYMSPEQIQDSKRVDIRSDIYSLGATFYHMLTGRPPYPGQEVYEVLHRVMTAPVPNPKESRPELSESNTAICMRMMEKDAVKRYQSPTDVLGDLAKSAAGEPVGIELMPLAPAAAAGAVSAPTPLAVSGAPAAPAPVPLVVDLSGPRRGPSGAGIAILAGVAMLALVAVVIGFVAVANARRDRARHEAEAARAREERLMAEHRADQERLAAEAQARERAAREPEPGAQSPAPIPPASETQPATPVAPPAEKPVSLHEGALLAITFEEDGAAERPPVRDLSGKENDGSFRGSPVFAEGRTGRGLKFDGVDDWAALPAVSARSVSLWVKPGLPMQQGWLEAGIRVGQYQNRGIRDQKEGTSAGVFVGVGDLDVAVPYDRITSGWHHVIAVWDGATSVTVMIDGTLPDAFVVDPQAASSPAPSAQPATLPRVPTPEPGPALLGRTNRTWWGTGRATLAGTIDEVAAWNRALGMDEMNALAAMALKDESVCAEIGKRAPKKPPVEVAETPKPEDPPAEPPPADPPVAPAKKKGLAEGCVLALSFEPATLVQERANPPRGFAGDLSGSGNRAEKLGSTRFIAGRLGNDQGVMFDGSGRASGEQTEGGLFKVPALEERAVAFWFKCSERRAGIVYDGGTMDRRDASFLVGVHLSDTWDFWRQSSDGVSVGFWANDVIVPVENLWNGWHHFAMSWDGDRAVTVAVDGKIASCATWADRIETHPKTAKLGRRPAPANDGSGLIGTSRRTGVAAFAGFRGILDEFAVWSRPLSEEELTSLAGYAAKKKSYCEEIERLAKEK
ncbi:MAG: protein kinase [Planctomycetia bacterium]|nr:protein kinase [Planctomycetia bacterium]